MSIRQSHICANNSQKLKISLDKPYDKESWKPLRTIYIKMTPGKQLLKLT